MDIYSENILDHYSSPRNKGKIKNPSSFAEDFNPSCGDKISIELLVNKNGVVEDIKFNGTGCAISQAAASMLTEMVKGKKIEEIKKIEKKELLDEIGISLGVVRLKCALLPFKVLKLATYKYLGKKLEEQIY